MANVIFVNPYVPGQIKQDRVMNVGLLVVATCASKEFTVEIVDHYSNPWAVLTDHVQNDTLAIAFSCSGAESFCTALAEAQKIKAVFPNIVIIVGGQHITGLYQADILPINSTSVDCFLPGPGEQAIRTVLKRVKQGLSVDKVWLGSDTGILTSMDYSLYPDWKSFIPSVEIGRGCNHNCHFCNSENMRRVSRYLCRDIASVSYDVENIVNYYGEQTDIFLFGSIFGENTTQTHGVLDRLRQIAPNAKYTFNLRTDCRWENFMEPLSHLTIRSVFFGMESASNTILLNMNKTRDPREYIAKSETIFRVFSELDIPFFTSFILGYWGETIDTISQTSAFIDRNSEYLKAIGVNQYYIYPGSHDFANIHNLAKMYNGVICYHPESQTYTVDKQGNLSGSTVQKVCRELEQRYNNPDYFEMVRSWRFRECKRY